MDAFAKLLFGAECFKKGHWL